MVSGNIKMLFYVAWVIAVVLGAIALGITSVMNWIVVACVAFGPPYVVRSFWHTPEQTTSESINNARR